MASAKDVIKIPKYAPGKGVGRALKLGTYRVKGDTVNPSSDSSPQYLFNIPANSFVQDIVLEVGTSYNGTYILVGIAGDCDCFISDTTAALAGRSYSMKGGANAAIYKGGYNSSCDQVVEIRYDGSTGTIVPWLFFSPYSNEDNGQKD